MYGKRSDRAAVRAFLLARLPREDVVAFVAYAADATVGFVQLYPGISSVALARTFVLNDLYVVPSCRRRGAGRALLAAATAHARDAGAASLSLSTEKTNRNAQTLYESAGWTRDDQFHVYHRDPGK